MYIVSWQREGIYSAEILRNWAKKDSSRKREINFENYYLDIYGSIKIKGLNIIFPSDILYIFDE